jgi:hypothetical protein
MAEKIKEKVTEVKAELDAARAAEDAAESSPLTVVAACSIGTPDTECRDATPRALTPPWHKDLVWRGTMC